MIKTTPFIKAIVESTKQIPLNIIKINNTYNLTSSTNSFVNLNNIKSNFTTKIKLITESMTTLSSGISTIVESNQNVLIDKKLTTTISSLVYTATRQQQKINFDEYGNFIFFKYLKKRV